MVPSPSLDPAPQIYSATGSWTPYNTVIKLTSSNPILHEKLTQKHQIEWTIDHVNVAGLLFNVHVEVRSLSGGVVWQSDCTQSRPGKGSIKWDGTQSLPGPFPLPISVATGLYTCHVSATQMSWVGRSSDQDGVDAINPVVVTNLAWDVQNPGLPSQKTLYGKRATASLTYTLNQGLKGLDVDLYAPNLKAET